MSKWGRRKRKAPEGFDVLEPTLKALEEELRNRVVESTDGKTAKEAQWPIHQINWQKTRYVYDMHFKYGKVSREVLEFCCQQKLIDQALCSQWRKQGYEKLCSTYAINPANFPFGTTSICRVPLDKRPDKQNVKDATTGCRGCASGPWGYGNIFGNKYGQRLAKLQILRENHLKRLETAEDKGKNADKGQNSSVSEPWVSEKLAKELNVDNDEEVVEEGEKEKEEDKDNNENSTAKKRKAVESDEEEMPKKKVKDDT